MWLRGEHDLSTVAELCKMMARAIAADDGDVVIDLSAVEFMSAATVGVIVRSRDFLRTLSRSLAVRAPSRCARRILDVCEVADLIAVDRVDRGPGRQTANAFGHSVTAPARRSFPRKADTTESDHARSRIRNARVSGRRRPA